MVGLKVIEVVQRDELARRAAELGERLKRGLLSLKQRYPCIGDVRGRGLLLGLEFNALDRDERHSARVLSDGVTNNAPKLGLSQYRTYRRIRWSDAYHPATDGDRGRNRSRSRPPGCGAKPDAREPAPPSCCGIARHWAGLRLKYLGTAGQMTARRPPRKASGFASPERGRTTGRGPCRTRWQGWRPRERTKSSKIGTSRHPAARKSVAATHSPGRIRSVCTIQAAARAADERDRRAPRAASRCHRT